MESKKFTTFNDDKYALLRISDEDYSRLAGQGLAIEDDYYHLMQLSIYEDGLSLPEFYRACCSLYGKGGGRY